MAVEWRKFYRVEGLEVSRNGAVRRTYDDCRTYSGKSVYPAMLERQVDKDGNLYVEIRKPWRKNIRIDFLVAKCFLPKPDFGQTLLIHKDKNKEHCWAGNLQWATPYEYAMFYNVDPKTMENGDEDANTESVLDHPLVDGFRLLWGDVYVSEKAEVKVNDEVLNVYDSYFDSDLDIEVGVRPFVYISGKSSSEREFLEELVAAAFLPTPKDKLSVLLHKDLDYKNCSSDNLEWVSSDNEDYKKYVEKRKAETNERTFELNPHRVESLKKSQLFD